MNTGTHVVKDKRVYAYRKVNPDLRKYLEERTGGRLTKVTLLNSPNTDRPLPCWRWRLDGIPNQRGHWGNRKYTSLFQEMIPELEYILETHLVRVCEIQNRKAIILDLDDEETLFSQETLEDKVAFIDTDDFLDWREERYPFGKKPTLTQLYLF